MKPTYLPIFVSDAPYVRVCALAIGYYLVRRYVGDTAPRVTIYKHAATHSAQRKSALARGALIASGKFRRK